jgi:hypothetical protein
MCGVRGWCKRGAAAAAVLVLAGCGVGNPFPDIPGGGRVPVTVTLIGDSLLVQTVPKLAGAFAWNGVNATIVDHSAGGVGLLDAGARTNIDTLLDAAPAGSIVVYEFSGNCLFSCPYTYGSDAFFNAWDTQIWNLILDAKARKLIPVWVSGPPMDATIDPLHASTAARIASDVAGIANWNGVDLCDWTSALADENGAYQQELWYADPFADPAVHQVRDPDGVHLAVDGPARSADWLAVTVAQISARLAG